MENKSNTNENLALNNAKNVKEYIKSVGINASDQLMKTLDIFTHTEESEVNQEIKAIKKYQPEVYEEYLNILREKKKKEYQENKTTENEVTVEKNNIQPENEFIEKYKRDKKIATLLNEQYYNSPVGGFGGGFNSFYDEGDTIFAKRNWDSKIYKFDGENLIDLGKEYYIIEKCGDFYLGVQVQTNNNGRLIEGSRADTVLDKQGNEIKKLKGPLWYYDSLKIYRETYEENKRQIHSYYDENMNLVTEKIPSDNHLQVFRDGKGLFVNRKNQRFVIEKGQSWNEKYLSDTELENEAIYQEYQKNEQDKRLEAEKEQKSKEGVPLNFSIEFNEPNQRSVKNIKDKSGNSIFSADEKYKYEVKYPFFLSGEAAINRQKENINKGIFVLSGYENDKAAKSIFINANTALVMEFEGSYSPFIKGKILQHFINGSEAEIFSLEGEKIGKQNRDDHRDNEHYYLRITNDNGKKQLIENESGKLLPQEFDEQLKQYNYGDKEIVIVKNNGEIYSIEISKSSSE
ncbi:MAG TPA: hypothetical protein PKD96_02400 [Candidatus Absconditabacterales bacterium]|nr:hypothetical protein [Candidatus Absconditabacterales bacterium]HMT27132.1 hypothetical protein [Candidatus Absconditabacterales bacterium]